jgi:hypothetical protein
MKFIRNRWLLSLTAVGLVALLAAFTFGRKDQARYFTAKAQTGTINDAAPGSATTAQVVFGADNWFTNIQGTEPQYFDIRSWPMQEGVSFTESDVSSAADVAVINNPVAPRCKILGLPALATSGRSV